MGLIILLTIVLLVSFFNLALASDQETSFSEQPELSASARPPAPTLRTPVDGAYIESTTITFSWNAAARAENYRLRIVRISDNTVFYSRFVGNRTSYTVSGFAGAGESYRWQVQAINASGSSSYSEAFVFNNQKTNKVESVTISADPPSPTTAGERLTFTATAQGGVSPEYRFFYRVANGSWQTAGSYSSNNTFTTNTSATGQFEIGVMARSGGSSDLPARNSISHRINAADQVQSVTLSANPPSPTRPGQPITFTARASGVTSPEYRFLYRSYPGGSWISAGSYSASNSFSGTPSATGDYQVGVLVRSAGSSASSEAQNSIIHTIARETEGSAFFEASAINVSPEPTMISFTPYGTFNVIYTERFTVSFVVRNSGVQAGTQDIYIRAIVSYDWGQTWRGVTNVVTRSMTVQPGQSIVNNRTYNGHPGALLRFFLTTDDDEKIYELLIL